MAYNIGVVNFSAIAYYVFLEMEFFFRLQKLCQMENKRLVLTMGIIASCILLFQCFTLSNRSTIVSEISAGTVTITRPRSYGFSSPNVEGIIEVSTSRGSLDSSKVSIPDSAVKRPVHREESKAEYQNEVADKKVNVVNDLSLDRDGDPDDDDDDVDLDEDVNIDEDILDKQTDELSDQNSTFESIEKPMNEALLEEKLKPEGHTSVTILRKGREDLSPEFISNSSEIESGSSHIELPTTSDISVAVQENLNANLSDLIVPVSPPPILSTKNKINEMSSGKNAGMLQVTSTISSGNITMDVTFLKKKKWANKRPRTIAEMNRILQRSRINFHLKPRRPSIRDRELVSARTQIENAQIVKDDHDLHPPLFRNVSRFKRSYELMERILKIYVYKDGERPIFHTPLLKGIYASEGWFLKLMQRNKHYVVKDPRKAHLFYLPFSTRLLEFTLHKRGQLKQDMAAYLQKYVDTISKKYPFWNRANGTDHFLAACHDWAPYETRPHLVTAIRALCNADIAEGFTIGKDVSLPETYVRSARNPLRDIGGNPASKRPFLAFFAGNMHGWVRPVLLKYWEDKDPDMKIFGPMPQGVKSKMNYISYMKNSKYCICPRGYEVNSPRVVEAIFYECVPVIISDNFVPPFFEVLNWEAFAVFVAEKDIPNLKSILLSITEEKYVIMQQRVKKLQRHFLWHNVPIKYDIFHMTLHSIWLNRVNLLRL